VDAVVVGQAFHWFAPERALPEIARVLRPGGVLGLLWSFSDDRATPWISGFCELTGSGYYTKHIKADKSPQPHDGFHPWERAEFPHAHRRTAESLVDTISTYSCHLVLPPDEQAARGAEALAYLRARPETASGEFDVPMTTIAFRSQPLPR
jgi:SAM-dependent methyltransferase